MQKKTQQDRPVFDTFLDLDSSIIDIEGIASVMHRVAEGSTDPVMGWLISDLVGKAQQLRRAFERNQGFAVIAEDHCGKPRSIS